MFYVVLCPLGLLSTTVRPCTPRASHAEQTKAYISPSSAMQQLQTGIMRYHDIVILSWALSRYRDPTNFHDSSPRLRLKCEVSGTASR